MPDFYHSQNTHQIPSHQIVDENGNFCQQNQNHPTPETNQNINTRQMEFDLPFLQARQIALFGISKGCGVMKLVDILQKILVKKKQKLIFDYFKGLNFRSYKFGVMNLQNVLNRRFTHSVRLLFSNKEIYNYKVFQFRNATPSPTPSV